MANIAEFDFDEGKLRLDPYQSSHQLHIGDKFYKLDTKGAVVRKTLSCGLPISMALPARAFEGVAARAIEDENGKVMVSLELRHRDPELSVPLLFANDMTDVAADWHSWSRLMKLPMLILDIAGNPTPVQRMLGQIMLEEPWERRKRITTPRYRPNFLRRRQQGVVSTVTKISASEIIARR
ncbi:MAG: DUF6101 family protein [Pseudomonadota bacterium]